MEKALGRKILEKDLRDCPLSNDWFLEKKALNFIPLKD